MTEYAVVIERSPNNFGAWVPDLEVVCDCKTLEEVKRNIVEAIEMHIESLRNTVSQCRLQPRRSP